jgi:hypothetical protein
MGIDRVDGTGMASDDGKLEWMAIEIVVTVMSTTPAGENS